MRAHGIGREHGAGAVERDGLDRPVGVVPNFVFNHVEKFGVRERGLEKSVGGGEDFWQAEEIGGLGGFFDGLGDDLLLVLTAVAIAGGIGVAFAREGEGAFAVDVLDAGGEGAAFISAGGKILVDVEVDAVEGVDNGFYGIEADLDGLVDFYVEEVGDSIFRHLDAVDTGMSELIFETSGAVELDIIIPRDGDEEDFRGGRVDDGDNIDVAAGGGGEGGARVRTGEINDERSGAKLRWLFLRLAFLRGFGSDALEVARKRSVVMIGDTTENEEDRREANQDDFSCRKMFFMLCFAIFLAFF